MRKHKPMSFDELLMDLKGENHAKENSNEITLAHLLNDSFMNRYTRFKNYTDFLAKGNFQVTSIEDIANIPEELLDRYINRETDFPDWKTMLAAANKEFSDK